MTPNRRASRRPKPTTPDRTSRTADRRARSQSGAALLAATAVVLFAAVLMTAVARVGARMVEVHRAQAVADVSALGGVAGGRAAVVQIAAANDARVVEVRERPDGALDVTIVVGGTVASAAATSG